MLVVTGSSSALAQPIGTFQWQLQPYCNALTVTVVQSGGVYTLDGFDDQCGAAVRAPSSAWRRRIPTAPSASGSAS